MVISSDPSLAASVYAHRLQDLYLERVIKPLHAVLDEVSVPGEAYLWFVRYGRRGPHLKLRIHASSQAAPALRRELSARTETFFAGPLLADDGEPPPAALELPPIDAQDEGDGLAPDRTLVWIDYRRSPVTLGPEPFPADDAYCAHFTRCLGLGCRRLVDQLELDGGIVAHPLRQRVLLRLVIAALGAVELAPEERAAYLAFHRDWLIRFTLLKAGGTLDKAGELLALYDRRADGLGAGLDRIRSAAAESWERAGGGADPDPAWTEAWRGFQAHVGRLGADPDFHVDPFARSPFFPPLFKVLHGWGNQLGLQPLSEAMTHHLLLRTAGEPMPAFTAQPPPAVEVAGAV